MNDPQPSLLTELALVLLALLKGLIASGVVGGIAALALLEGIEGPVYA